MQNYSIAEIHEHASEVLEQAAIEPVLLTAGSKPGYMIMSAQGYQQLLERLETLENAILGQLAETALTQSHMVGSEQFTAELQRLAQGDAAKLSAHPFLGG